MRKVAQTDLEFAAATYAALVLQTHSSRRTEDWHAVQSNHALTRGFWVSYDVCMKQMLTTKSLDSMLPAAAKRYEVRDQKVNGLHVRVSTTAAKVFYTLVRPNGTRRRIKIGPYPRRSAISGFGRLKERIEARLPENTPDWRFHDFRRTASTGMAKVGVTNMKTKQKRTYCPKCLKKLGVLNDFDHLQELEDLGRFPRRSGPTTWDADKFDKWYMQGIGMRPPKIRCKCRSRHR